MSGIPVVGGVYNINSSVFNPYYGTCFLHSLVFLGHLFTILHYSRLKINHVWNFPLNMIN